jgi:hypothetical protein
MVSGRTVRVAQNLSQNRAALPVGSDVPTEPAPVTPYKPREPKAREVTIGDQEEPEFDSEAPTGVVTDRPLLPRPPRSPTL